MRTVKLDLFPSLRVVFCYSEEEFLRKIKGVSKKEHDDMVEAWKEQHPQGQVLKISTQRTFWIFCYVPVLQIQEQGLEHWTDTVVHECVHIMAYIFDHYGLEISAENDEAMAYTVAYLVTQCTRGQ